MVNYFISVVIPVFNEENNIEPLCDSIVDVFGRFKRPCQIVFVDDGSVDGTLQKLKSIVKKYTFITIVSLGRNWGKTAGYRVGFQHADGEILVTMDGDLQDDPDDIPLLVNPVVNGCDMTIGWKATTTESIGKPLSSRMFSLFASALTRTRFHDVDCPFRAMRRVVAQSIEFHGDLYRFIPIIARIKGFNVTEVKVKNRARYSGYSKFNRKKMVKGLFDLLTIFFLVRFRGRPLHFFGLLGLLFCGTGFTIDLLLVANGYLFNHGFINHSALLLFGVMLLVIGIQFMSIGLIGEMISSAQGRNINELPVEKVINYSDVNDEYPG